MCVTLWLLTNSTPIQNVHCLFLPIPSSLLAQSSFGSGQLVPWLLIYLSILRDLHNALLSYSSFNCTGGGLGWKKKQCHPKCLNSKDLNKLTLFSHDEWISFIPSNFLLQFLHIASFALVDSSLTTLFSVYIYIYPFKLSYLLKHFILLHQWGWSRKSKAGSITWERTTLWCWF